MTRKSKREIRRTLDDLDAEQETGGRPQIVHQDPETGEWYDDPELTDGPLDKDSTDPLMVLQETVVETGYDE